MSCTDKEARAIIIELGRRMYARGYVTANDGNISVRAGDNRIWITPAGVSKGFMDESMLVCVDMDGHVLDGKSRASSELAMHLRVYRENAQIQSAVHAHPVTATAFAMAHVPLDLALGTESVMGLGVVPVVPYAATGSEALADAVAPYCRDFNAVLLANHGALSWGENAIQAYYRMESLEGCAELMFKLGYLDGKPARLLSRQQRDELISLRTARGISTGGVPRCAEEL